MRHILIQKQRYLHEAYVLCIIFQVEYFFDKDCEECSIFEIDRITGEIRLTGTLEDEKDSYSLLVNAIDGDGSMQASERNEAPSMYISRFFKTL